MSAQKKTGVKHHLVDTVIAAVIAVDPMKTVKRGLHQNAAAEIDVEKGQQLHPLVVEVGQRVARISLLPRTPIVKSE